MIITAIFLVLAGLFNSLMDITAEEAVFYRSKLRKLDPKWWLKSESWKNKYASHPNGTLITMTLGDGKTAPKPKFWGSNTFLVFITDAWHLFQFLMFGSICISLITITTIDLELSGLGILYGVFICRALIGAGFWLGYYRLFGRG